MRQISTSASIRAYLLDLVYLNATLTAGDHISLATRVQAEIETVRAERAELERAEELEVIAQAFIAGRDVTLDTGLIEAGKFVRAHHPEEYKALFPKAPSDIAVSAYRAEIANVRTVVAKLDQLPDNDSVRGEFSPRLAAAAAALETSIEEKEDVSRGVALVRLKLEKRRAAVNLLRTEIYADLLKLMKAKRTADRYFRTGSTSKKDDADEPATPAPTDTPVVPPVVP